MTATIGHDTAAMNLFLVELSTAVAPGAHGIVLVDKAGWHTASELRVPENLNLVSASYYRAAGIVNLAGRGMLVVSVARWLGSEGPLLAYCAVPL
jgi:hypothetical protein